MDRNAEIKRLWMHGYSASGIAERMKISRNVVMGVIHRAKQGGEDMARTTTVTYPLPEAEVIPFPNPAPAPKPVGQQAKKRRAAPKSYATLLCEEAKKPVKGVRLVDLEPHHCRYVLDDGSFCGERRKLRSSFCDNHHSICWVPSIKRPKQERKEVEPFRFKY